VGFQEVEKKFVFICALAVFRNRFILLPDFLRRARASKPCDEVVGHFFNLKLQAHSRPFLTRRITSIEADYTPRGRDAELGKSGVRKHLKRVVGRFWRKSSLAEYQPGGIQQANDRW